MDAIWQTDGQMPHFPQLESDLHTDVLIIGGGLAGILCAWNLSRAGARCALIEQGRIMGGVSGRTTAKLTSQHGLIYGKLLKTHGPVPPAEAGDPFYKHGAFFLKLYQQRSYVIAQENAPAVEGMYLSCQKDGLSVRSAGQYLLLGGGGTGEGKAAKMYFSLSDPGPNAFAGNPVNPPKFSN